MAVARRAAIDAVRHSVLTPPLPSSSLLLTQVPFSRPFLGSGRHTILGLLTAWLFKTSRLHDHDMSNFAALMALSVSQTRQSEAAVQSALAERQKKEAQKRKEQEEKDRRDRELQAKLRLKRLEEQKRDEERRRRHEEERRAKEREAERRAEQERDALRYGPKGGRTDKSGYPVSGSARGGRSNDDDGAASALTREEKRQRRLQADLRGSKGSFRRTTAGSGFSKPGRRLPGGAVDITTKTLGLSSQASPGRSQSVKERIAAEPVTLYMVNQQKRDTRTIDEIVQDNAKLRQGKVLDGDQAREFSDWFGKAKKDTAKKPTTSTSTSRANTPAVAGPSSSSQSKAASGSASPHPLTSASKSQSVPKGTPPAARGSASAPGKFGSASKATTNGKPSTVSSFSAKAPRPPTSAPSKSAAPTSRPPAKKRPRSPSSSLSPPPAKRRPSAAGSARNDISSEIWKLFGKDRSSYIQRDVYSDDEDMEAGAFDVEKEELRRSVLRTTCAYTQLTDNCPGAVCASRRRRMSLPWKKNGGTRTRSGAGGRRRRSAARTERRTHPYMWVPHELMRRGADRGTGDVDLCYPMRFLLPFAACISLSCLRSSHIAPADPHCTPPYKPASLL